MGGLFRRGRPGAGLSSVGDIGCGVLNCGLFLPLEGEQLVGVTGSADCGLIVAVI